MTEAEWLACDDPMPMFGPLRGRVSKRKCLLFTCACERRLWGRPDCKREKVEATERYAEGRGTAAGVLAALLAIGIDAMTLEGVTDMDSFDWAEDGTAESAAFAANVARQGAEGEDEDEDERAWDAAFTVERAAQAALLRDVVGNPFRLARVDPACGRPSSRRSPWPLTKSARPRVENWRRCASPSSPTPSKKPAAPTPPSSITCARPAHTCAAAGRST